jgi:hypothetical protein
MIAGLLVSERVAAAGAALIALSTLVISATFVARLRADIAHYRSATTLQNDALATLERLLPMPSRGSTIYTFGFAAETAPGIPIFRSTWDLTGAIRLQWSDPSLSALPVYRTGVVCGTSTLHTRQFGTGHASRYRRSLFVDLGRRIVERIDSETECRRATRAFRPGARLLSQGRASGQASERPARSGTPSPPA